MLLYKSKLFKIKQGDTKMPEIKYEVVDKIGILVFSLCIVIKVFYFKLTIFIYFNIYI